MNPSISSPGTSEGPALLGGYFELALLQDLDGGDVVLGNAGVEGTVLTGPRNADSAAVATPGPGSSFLSSSYG
jgi:hypothetical protein